MNADETQVLGCIYLLPNDDRMYRTAEVTSHDGTDLSSVDATVAFWVRVSTWESGFERALLKAVLEWLREFLRDPSSFVLGAYIDDSPVGLAWGLQMRSPSGRLTTYVHELAVHEDWQRQGVGSALVRQAMTLARRQRSTTRSGCSGRDNGLVELVGRRSELQVLVDLADAARRGTGSVAVVTGEPGIGKTRLAQEVTATVGLPVGWSGCWDGMAAPPLWPWQRLLTQLGEDAPADLLTAAAPSDDGPDVAAARYARYAGVVERLAARTEPAIAVIDDLQWADSSTIELLRVVAAEVHTMPLVVVALARSAPSDLAATARVRLEGLSTDAVGVLAASISPGSDPDWIVRRSGGNPLYAIELLRSPPGAGVPPGLRGMIRERLHDLSGPVRAVLDAIAVAGPEVDTSVLAALSAAAPEAMVSLLEEAVQRGVIEWGGTGWSFCHDVLREVVGDELGAEERCRIHAATAAVLAATPRPEPGRVAHHLVAADPVAADVAVVSWACRAAEAATAAFADEEAARWYEAAAVRQPTFEVLVAWGEVLLRAGDLDRARRVFDDAVATARATGRGDLLARAALAYGAGLAAFEVRLFDRHQIDLLEEALDAMPPGEEQLRARVLGRLSVALSFLEPVGRRVTLSSEAVAAARRDNDPATRVECLAAHLDALAGPDHAAERFELVDEMLTAALDAEIPSVELLARRYRLGALAERGDMAGFDRELLIYGALADLLRAPLFRWYVPMFRAMRAMWERRWDDAAALTAEAAALGAAAGSTNAGLLALSQDASRAFFTADWSTFDALYHQALAQHPSIADHPSTRAMLAAGAARRGRPDQARALVEALTVEGCAAVLHDSSRLETLVKLADAVTVLADPELVAPIRDALVTHRGLWAFDGLTAICWGPVAAAVDALDQLAPPQPSLPPARSPTPAVSGWLRRQGDTWEIGWDGTSVIVRDSLGLRDIAAIVAVPHRPIPAVDLDGRVRSGDLGPVADRSALDAYRRRLADLDVDIEAAEADHDLERVSMIRAERDDLVDELTRAVGLGGRSRRVTDDAERARQAVTARIRRSVDRIGDLHPTLGRHLQVSVRTGALCSYEPDRDVRWDIS